PSSPGYIEEFNRNKLTCVGADNDIMKGVGNLFSLIKDNKFKFFAGKCPNVLDEISTYHYPAPADIKPDQNEKNPMPVKQNDHAMDALRYVALGISYLDKKKTARAPVDKTQERRWHKIERLKKGKKRVSQTENWN
ncbi:MAG: hypothetical protein ACXABY_31225, partial [Candidatus Thorarchaeota archaeon]